MKFIAAYEEIFLIDSTLVKRYTKYFFKASIIFT